MPFVSECLQGYNSGEQDLGDFGEDSDVRGVEDRLDVLVGEKLQ